MIRQLLVAAIGCVFAACTSGPCHDRRVVQTKPVFNAPVRDSDPFKAPDSYDLELDDGHIYRVDARSRSEFRYPVAGDVAHLCAVTSKIDGATHYSMRMYEFNIDGSADRIR